MEVLPKERKRSFECKVCGQTFVGQGELRLHMDVHPEMKVNMCKVCNEDLITGDALKKHLKSHWRKRTYMCDVCGMSLSDHASFRRHLLRHTGEKNYICDICKKGFVTNSNLAVHRKSHSDVKSFLCLYCNTGFRFRGVLRKHISRIHPFEKFGLCYVLNEDGSLSVQKKMSEEEKHYMCFICMEDFQDKTIFKVHLSEHKISRFFCFICSEDFNTIYRLERHLLCHSGAELHACVICGKKFLESYTLRNHMEIHKREVFPPCKKCGVRVKPDSEHICRKRVPCFKCSHCSSEFYTKKVLARHLTSHLRTGHVCGYCGQVFSEKKSLEVHAEHHLKETDGMANYVQSRLCESCGQTFDYGVHHLCKGSRDLKYSCSECSEKFCDNLLLARHMKYHDKDRPFVCGYCGWRFARKCNLKKHSYAHQKQKANLMLDEEDLHGDAASNSDGEISNGDRMNKEISNQSQICRSCGEKFAYGFDHECKDNQYFAFSCSECHAKYPEESLLEKHMKYHDKSRLFACHFCGWRFVRKCNLKRHLDWHMKLEHEAVVAADENECHLNFPAPYPFEDASPDTGINERFTTDDIKSEERPNEFIAEFLCETEFDAEDLKSEGDSTLSSYVNVDEFFNSDGMAVKCDPVTAGDHVTDPLSL